MINQQKIIKMTALARMEKQGIEKYKRITEYYIEDYVYKNNFQTRLLVGLLALGFSAAKVFWEFQQGANIPVTLEEVVIRYVLPYGIFIVGVLVVYTMISTVVYTQRYKYAEKKVKEYKDILQSLDELDEISSNYIRVKEENE